MFQMVLQGAAAPVRLSTHGAGQWPEISVSQGMSFQAGGIVEHFFTLVTGVSLVTKVTTLVLPQALVGVESFFTDVAAVGPGVQVAVPVVGEGVHKRK